MRTLHYDGNVLRYLKQEANLLIKDKKPFYYWQELQYNIIEFTLSPYVHTSGKHMDMLLRDKKILKAAIESQYRGK